MSVRGIVARNTTPTMGTRERLVQIRENLPPKREGQDEYFSPQYRQLEWAVNVAIRECDKNRNLERKVAKLEQSDKSAA